MPPKNPITQKIISRLDQIDRKVLESHLTDLAETAQTYRDLLEELPEGVLLLDGEGAISWMNSAARDISGLPLSALSRRKNWLDQVEDQALAAFLGRRLKSPPRKSTESLSIFRPRERFLRMTWIPLSSEEKAGTAVLMADHTQEHEKAFEKERLARLEDLMSLTAGIAHEIGNPLNALSIHIQLLKKEARDKKKDGNFDERLAVMESEIRRLDSIIKSFLKATRRTPLRLHQESLNLLLEEVIAVMRPEAEQSKVWIEFEGDKKIPDFLLDRGRLYQALMNLIKNGIESMPKGGRLHLRLTHKDRLAALRIEDQGNGIRDEDMPHIFQAFYTTKQQGTGLGLMSVAQAVSEHGGKIDVSTRLGKGTVFTIYLPIRTPKLQLPKAS